MVGFESHQEVARILRDRLIRRMTEAGEPAPVIEPAPSKPGGRRNVTPEEAVS